jgi:hypothetical protein
MAEVRPRRLDPQSAGRVLGVLNAGTTIHAVEYDPENDRYLVRAELFEFLSGVSKKSFKENTHHATIAEMEKTVSAALLPDIAHNIDTVLSYLHPITEKHGFMAEIKLGEVTDETDKRVVRQVLNAGSVHQRVQRTDTDTSHYFVHRDLYQTLARLRVRTMSSAEPQWINAKNAERPQVAAAALDTDPPKLEHHARGESSPQAAVQADENPEERAAIRDRLMTVMNLDPSAYEDLVRSGALPHARLLGDQLRRLCQNPAIGAHINLEVQDFNTDLERAKDELRREQFSPAAVDTAASDVEAVLPALLLTHDGRYVDALNGLITNLENSDGDGGLNPKERQLLKRLRHHEAALSRIARESSADWRKVAALIEELADGASPGGYRREAGQRRPN